MSFNVDSKETTNDLLRPFSTSQQSLHNIVDQWREELEADIIFFMDHAMRVHEMDLQLQENTKTCEELVDALYMLQAQQDENTLYGDSALTNFNTLDQKIQIFIQEVDSRIDALSPAHSEDERGSSANISTILIELEKSLQNIETELANSFKDIPSCHENDIDHSAPVEQITEIMGHHSNRLDWLEIQSKELSKHVSKLMTR